MGSCFRFTLLPTAASSCNSGTHAAWQQKAPKCTRSRGIRQRQQFYTRSEPVTPRVRISKVISVEKNPKIADFLRRNLENFNLLDRCTIVNYSVEKFLLNCQDIKFDIIYMDPPFSYNLEELLQIFSNFRCYHKKSIFILHHFFKNKPKENLCHWKILDSRTYSSNTITFYVPKDPLDD